jgi:hypothetical protein
LAGPSFWSYNWSHLDAPRHLYHFDAPPLSYCLEQAGFTLEAFQHVELEHDLMGWSQSTLNCIFSTPNVFLDFLMGKGKRRSTGAKISNVVLGSLLTLACAPVVPFGSFLGTGATVITVATRKVYGKFNR